MAVNRRRSSGESAKRKPGRKPKSPRLKRHIPGTRFVIGELLPERLHDPRARKIFENAVRQGFIQRVPEHIVAGEAHPEHFYFIPVQLPTKKDPNTLHQRTISAMLPFGKGKRGSTAKGSGAYFGFFNSEALFPFFEIRADGAVPHHTSAQFDEIRRFVDRGKPPVGLSGRFYGGMLEGYAKKASRAAEKISGEFSRALQEKDPVAEAARKMGLAHPPIPVIFGLFRPRQTIMQFIKTGRDQSKTISTLKAKMTQGERRAFDFSFKRAEPGQVIEMKLERGMELAGIRKELRESQVVQFLSLESNLRVDELERLYYQGKVDLMNAPMDVVAKRGRVIKKISGGRIDTRARARKSLRQWVEVFAEYGFELRPGEGGGYTGHKGFEGSQNRFKDYAVYRNGHRVSMKTAVREILKRFATSMALNYHLVDTRLEGTYHVRGPEFAGDAIKPKDVTARGEIADLEDIDLHPPHDALRDGQLYDHKVCTYNLKQFVNKISRHRTGETGWGNEQKELLDYAKGIFKGLVKQGIAHMETQRQPRNN